MYNVQRDLQALRAEVVEKEVSAKESRRVCPIHLTAHLSPLPFLRTQNALTNNEQMQKLEEECEWYRKESLRLDGLLGQSKKNEMFMKEKMAMLEDDRNWLAKQLKAAKKQNKLLRSEIELQLREGTDANEEMFAGQIPQMSTANDQTMSLPQLTNNNADNNKKTSAWAMKQSQSAAALLPTDTLEVRSSEDRKTRDFPSPPFRFFSRR